MKNKFNYFFTFNQLSIYLCVVIIQYSFGYNRYYSISFGKKIFQNKKGNMTIIENPPSPNLANSLRYTSHDNKSAIMDIIDNSIDADANIININFGFKNGQTFISFSDNGYGMDKETLIKALTYGYHESGGSLGKFGMGLKSSAGHLGESFYILTKKEKGPIIKGVYDWEEITKNNKWMISIEEQVSEEDKNTFYNLIKDSEAGTIINISNLKAYDDKNIYTFADNIRKEIGRVFRYFLTPKEDPESNIGKIKIFVNDKEIYGVDPMERHLKSTKILYDQDIFLKNKKFVHVVVVHLSKSEDGTGTGVTDLGNFNFKPNFRTQGVYVIRENREISDGDATLFELLGGHVKTSSLNYCRIEIRYSDLDSDFIVNHDKRGLKEVSQSTSDIIKQEISKYLTDISKVDRYATSANDVDTAKHHDIASKSISSKSATLDLPNGKSSNRTPTGEKRGTIHPKKTNIKRRGVVTNPDSKANTIKIETCNYGSAGQLFDYQLVNKELTARWNMEHPFYQRYIKASIREQVLSADMLLFAISSKLCKIEQEKGEEGLEFSENFIESLSVNLRSLSIS